ncbi:MAG: gliding motility protein RemB, partial [Flavobacteriaceae bacterium]|nr:gliding motility protein RemB [Flavobacteriaceae bacterium]
VITNQDSYDGFDISFFNPIIFYRAIEHSNGGDFSGNVQVGLNTKYRLNDNISFYSQLLLDELTVGELFSGDGYIGNKYAIQIGAKYYNAFKVDNLMLQGEFNLARPYIYSHAEPKLNAGHYNQAMTHLWGANFWETIGVARYSKDRWFANAKVIIGKKGFDFEGSGSNISYGGDIYRSYNDETSRYGNSIAQGNTTNIFIGDLQAGYILNPTTNLQIFGGFTYRSFTPNQSGNIVTEDNTTWVTFGVKSNLFNWYFDF